MWLTTFYNETTGEFEKLDKDTANPTDLIKLLTFAYNNRHLYDTKSQKLLTLLFDNEGYSYFFEQIASGKIKLSDLKDLLCISDCSNFLEWTNIDGDKYKLELYNKQSKEKYLKYIKMGLERGRKGTIEDYEKVKNVFYNEMFQIMKAYYNVYHGSTLLF